MGSRTRLLPARSPRRPSLATRPSQIYSPLPRRRTLHTTFIRSASDTTSQFKRSDFTGQGFTGYYEPGQPTPGPLGDASLSGAPRITPKVLKEHLDQFVVGQERAKRTLSVAVYNHYQRVQELQRREDEEDAMLAQQERILMNQTRDRDRDRDRNRDRDPRHPVEDEFPGQQNTINLSTPSTALISSSVHPNASSLNRIGTVPLSDATPATTIEKSNILLLGPSGVGKTLMAKTLARILEVPFSMSDCTPFTQAGYIGEDVEVCVQRLLAASNYDVAAAERGIICLDEIDKIATARVSNGKDVSGEGVQQALLKIIEGTTVQVQAKTERSSGRSSHGATSSSPTNSPLGGSSTTQSSPTKGETYNVNTDNILFICSGAFNNLHRVVLDRLAKGSMGFGARVRSSGSLSFGGSASSGSSSEDQNNPMIPAGDPENDDLFRKNLPFFSSTLADSSKSPPTSSSTMSVDEDRPMHNTLDLLTPSDLQKYGLIPELIGRIPISCALSPLSIPALMRVLTEPKNSLLSQYTAMFSLSGIDLRITTPALREIALAASRMSTGARGLRTVMERILQEAMFEAPGAGVRGVLVTKKAAKVEEAVHMFGRRGMDLMKDRWRQEEDDWEASRRPKTQEDEQPKETFEQYRERAKIAGAG